MMIPLRTLREHGRNACFSLLLAVGCADEGEASSDDLNDGDDIELVRADSFEQFARAVAGGQVPVPSALDHADFVAAHDFGIPGGICPETICPWGGLAMAPLPGSDHATAVAALAVAPGIEFDRNADRKPVHLVVVVEMSRTVANGHLTSIKDSLFYLRERMREDDRLTLVSFDDHIQNVFSDHKPSDDELSEIIGGLQVGHRANIYSGLRAAFVELSTTQLDDRQPRIVLISGGTATVGITAEDKITRLVELYAKTGMRTSVVLTGGSDDTRLARAIANAGGGAFYITPEQPNLFQPLELELNTSRIDLARNLRMAFEADSSYAIRGVYGNRRAAQEGNKVEFESATLQWSWSRDAETGQARPPHSDVGMTLVHLEFLGGATQQAGLLNYSFLPLEQSDEHIGSAAFDWGGDPGAFAHSSGHTHPAAQKALVVVHTLEGLKDALTQASGGDLELAQVRLQSLKNYLNANPLTTSDEDIARDRDLVRDLSKNIDDFLQ